VIYFETLAQINTKWKNNILKIDAQLFKNLVIIWKFLEDWPKLDAFQGIILEIRAV